MSPRLCAPALLSRTCPTWFYAFSALDCMRAMHLPFGRTASRACEKGPISTFAQGYVPAREGSVSPTDTGVSMRWDDIRKAEHAPDCPMPVRHALNGATAPSKGRHPVCFHLLCVEVWPHAQVRRRAGTRCERRRGAPASPRPPPRSMSPPVPTDARHPLAATSYSATRATDAVCLWVYQ